MRVNGGSVVLSPSGTIFNGRKVDLPDKIKGGPVVFEKDQITYPGSDGKQVVIKVPSQQAASK